MHSKRNELIKTQNALVAHNLWHERTTHNQRVIASKNIRKSNRSDVQRMRAMGSDVKRREILVVAHVHDMHPTSVRNEEINVLIHRGSDWENSVRHQIIPNFHAMR